MYEYTKSTKSSFSDELINTYLLRPIAGLLVRALYKTRTTPNQITIAATIVGITAAFVYLRGDPVSLLVAGLLITVKDVLDSADGQLARAKQQYSRYGRFLDSIGDFIVDAAVFASIGLMLSEKHGGLTFGILAIVGLAGITFRVSYHVFYHTSFLHLEEKYEFNRLTEEIRDEDRTEERMTFQLQRIFQFIYGWQDKLVLHLDLWCKGDRRSEDSNIEWYSNLKGLRLSGFLGMGTELFLLTLCSALNNLELYLYLNALLMNTVLLINIFYRRVTMRNNLSAAGFTHVS